jgi:hypothetical protein
MILMKFDIGDAELPCFFFNFLHRQVFLGVETRRFGSWICFRPQVEGRRKSKNPVILRAINHHQNPIKST